MILCASRNGTTNKCFERTIFESRDFFSLSIIFELIFFFIKTLYCQHINTIWVVQISFFINLQCESTESTSRQQIRTSRTKFIEWTIRMRLLSVRVLLRVTTLPLNNILSWSFSVSSSEREAERSNWEDAPLSSSRFRWCPRSPTLRLFRQFIILLL